MERGLLFLEDSSGKKYDLGICVCIYYANITKGNIRYVRSELSDAGEHTRLDVTRACRNMNVKREKLC